MQHLSESTTRLFGRQSGWLKVFFPLLLQDEKIWTFDNKLFRKITCLAALQKYLSNDLARPNVLYRADSKRNVCKNKETSIKRLRCCWKLQYYPCYLLQIIVKVSLEIKNNYSKHKCNFGRHIRRHLDYFVKQPYDYLLKPRLLGLNSNIF